MLKTLVDMAKGRIEHPGVNWFYSLFLDEPRLGIPDTIEEVRAKLQNAWWVEDADLYQEIKLFMFAHPTILESNMVECIARRLRDYLETQQVFSRQTAWSDAYQIYLATNQEPRTPEAELDLSLVMEPKLPLATFDRYIAYLSWVIKMPRQEMAKVLMCNLRSVYRLQACARKQLEEFYASKKSSGTIGAIHDA